MKIDRVYTRGGDAGETSLIGGQRVSKASPRVECYGTVDELNATIGMIRAALEASQARHELDPILARVQNELFDLGTQLATPDADRRAALPGIADRHVDALEHEIDKLNLDLPVLKSFVLPGGGNVGAHFHLARTVCRRVERLVIGHYLDGAADAIRYLNRLSDALFVLGRWASWKEGHAETLWEPGKT